MSQSSGGKILKILGGILLIILGLWLVHALFFYSGNNLNIGIRGGYNGSHFNMGIGMGNGIGTAGTFSFILMFLIKVLFVLFIVGLVVGIAIAVKKYLFTEEDIQIIKSTFTGEKNEVVKEVCSICGKELEGDWKVCPYCGKEK
jgi:hypothetical protein